MEKAYKNRKVAPQEAMQRVGLIAGSGSFPILFADEARQMGYSVVAVAHTGETLPSLQDKVDKIFWIRVGQLGRLIRILQDEMVTRAVMVGGIKKARFFANFRPDLRSIRIFQRIKERKDDSVLRAVADELEKEGIAIDGATRYIPSLVAGNGVLTRRQPTQREWEDLKFGFKVGREIGRTDVGQCIVVKRGTVLAVESMEGTDETIRRGGRFAPGAVVVKVSKPHQDLRFDLPTIGPGTIETMKGVGTCCLGIEAGRTVILERSTTIAEADAARITVVGLFIGLAGGD
jgi:DUF1009 family protein